jgi:hypothetical protein
MKLFQILDEVVDVLQMLPQAQVMGFQRCAILTGGEFDAFLPQPFGVCIELGASFAKPDPFAVGAIAHRFGVLYATFSSLSSDGFGTGSRHT